jgi:hypothetical protein
MNYNELIKTAEKGEDINLSVQKFSEMDELIKILEPYGYKITNISTFKGLSKPNCTFTKK